MGQTWAYTLAVYLTKPFWSVKKVLSNYPIVDNHVILSSKDHCEDTAINVPDSRSVKKMSNKISIFSIFLRLILIFWCFLASTTLALLTKLQLTNIFQRHQQPQKIYSQRVDTLVHLHFHLYSKGDCCLARRWQRTNICSFFPMDYDGERGTGEVPDGNHHHLSYSHCYWTD